MRRLLVRGAIARGGAAALQEQADVNSCCRLAPQQLVDRPVAYRALQVAEARDVPGREIRTRAHSLLLAPAHDAPLEPLTVRRRRCVHARNLRPGRMAI